MSLTPDKHAHLTKPACLLILLLDFKGRRSIENEALENEKHSTENPKGRKQSTLSRERRRIQTRKQCTHNSKVETKCPICH